jgi:hypothetical protein
MDYGFRIRHRILFFSSVAFEMPTKIGFFWLLFTVGKLTSGILFSVSDPEMNRVSESGLGIRIQVEEILCFKISLLG